MGDRTNALEFRDVTKRFGDVVAVDRVTLSIRSATFFGLLGRNGAGKSTLLNMVMGLVRPTSGSITVFGLSTADDGIDIRRNVGVLPERLALPDYLSGPQYLTFAGRMYGIPDADIAARTEELFATLDLSAGPRTLIADYSYGMRKKLALSAALLHAPRLLLLDEPFEGIDAVSSRTIKNVLQFAQRRGTTIVLTSHILHVVETLCSDVAIIDSGSLLRTGAVSDIRVASADRSLETIFVDLVGGAKDGELSWL